jgi:elongation factor Ts
LGRDVAMQAAAMRPQWLVASDVDPAALENEKAILLNQALNEGKPAAIIDKMVEGRIKKYYQDFCLLDQAFVKDPSKTISQLVTEAIAAIGEKISIRRFARYEMGEGLEKRADNLADEVAQQVAAAEKKAK